MANSRSNGYWFTTAELLDYFQISKSTLSKQKKYLVKDKHFKRLDPKNPKSSLLWRLDLLEEILGKPVASFQRQVLENAVKGQITCQY